MANKRYMLIDGNALVHRGFHAIRDLRTKSGEPTNAVYGFTATLLKAISGLKPSHIACCFDLAGPTFRHVKYEDYKATRVKAPDELYAQLPRVKEVVSALNIPIYEQEGFEADDFLGTLATSIHKQDKSAEIMIVTGDMDTLQLVNHKIKIYTLRSGLSDVAVYDSEEVFKRFGLTPEQMVDYKALRGDPSDNIPGVRGIGEKGASNLIAEFGSLDKLYKAIHSGKNLDKIKPRTLELLKNQEEQARFSYELSQIRLDVPIKQQIPEYKFTSDNLKTAIPLFAELEFNSLLSKLPKNYGPKGQDLVVENEGPKPKPKNWKSNYTFVDSKDKLKEFLTKLSKAKSFAVDSETTSLNPIDAKLVGLSFALTEGEAYYLPADLVLGSSELKKILEGPVEKIGHNIKYDYLILRSCGVELGGAWFDTMIASYLLNAGTRQHSLDALALSEFSYVMQPITDLIGKGKGQTTMDLVDPEKVSWYACEDADLTFRLKQIYFDQIKKAKLDKVFYDIEIPLIKVLAEMEEAGIALDAKFLANLSKQAKLEVAATEKEIIKLAGTSFNINSPKQLKEVLFDEMGLVSPDNKKNKSGLSTAATELEKMLGQHPIIALILKYRELSKLLSTYLEALPELVNKKTGRIHTSYNQTIAATGRLSSTDPNLQNIPIKGDGLGSEVRKAFVADAGYELLSLDYSQIELRIVAHLAKDKNMLKVFQNNEDIHTATAMNVFGVEASGVTADMRRDAKTINFGILYGLSSFGLSSRIAEISWGSAKDFIDKYFQAYPGVKLYIESVKEEVRKNGFVKNELGRIRKFPEIASSQFMVRAAAERAAVNFPIQSLAADIIKIAMINLEKELQGKNSEIKMLLQVHDELVFEVKKDKVGFWAKKIKQIMEEAIELSVPVIVEGKSGPNWGEMVKI